MIATAANCGKLHRNGDGFTPVILNIEVRKTHQLALLFQPVSYRHCSAVADFIAAASPDYVP